MNFPKITCALACPSDTLLSSFFPGKGVKRELGMRAVPR